MILHILIWLGHSWAGCSVAVWGGWSETSAVRANSRSWDMVYCMFYSLGLGAAHPPFRSRRRAKQKLRAAHFTGLWSGMTQTGFSSWGVVATCRKPDNLIRSKVLAIRPLLEAFCCAKGTARYKTRAKQGPDANAQLQARLQTLRVNYEFHTLGLSNSKTGAQALKLSVTFNCTLTPWSSNSHSAAKQKTLSSVFGLSTRAHWFLHKRRLRILVLTPPIRRGTRWPALHHCMIPNLWALLLVRCGSEVLHDPHTVM